MPSLSAIYVLASSSHDRQGAFSEDRFNLAVVGPFSRGKSGLMNAILGLEGAVMASQETLDSAVAKRNEYDEHRDYHSARFSWCLASGSGMECIFGKLRSCE